MFLQSCGDALPKGTIKYSEYALKLSTLEEQKKIKQSSLKKTILLYLGQDLKERLIKVGYGYRIDELINETWNVYEDKNYYIICGSAYENKMDGIIFALVFQNMGNGQYENIYVEIGDYKNGEYPKNIIPNEK